MKIPEQASAVLGEHKKSTPYINISLV